MFHRSDFLLGAKDELHNKALTHQDKPKIYETTERYTQVKEDSFS